MVGLALAAQLSDSGLSIALINRDPIARSLPTVADSRVSALNIASQQMLDEVGAWPHVDLLRTCGYTDMHVWEKDSFANIHFAATETSHDVLGTIVENQNIINALLSVVSQQSNVRIIDNFALSTINITEPCAVLTSQDGDVISTALVVGADGAQSVVRRTLQLPMTHWHYDHSAIVATIHTQLPHQKTARQAFTAFGPLAFLPLNDPHQCSIVWSQDTSRADMLMALTDDIFCQQLATTLDMQLGTCELLNKRMCIPLTMRYVRKWVSHRAVVIGDAAHTIHPLAGQGVNLGFQDSIALAQALKNLDKSQLGKIQPLRHFERARKSEAVKMIATMEGFKRLFAGNDPLQKLVRGLGMSAADKLPTAKRMLIQQAMGA